MPKYRCCWFLIAILALTLFPGCQQSYADDLFAGTWSGEITGQGADGMLAMYGGGIWQSSFKLEIAELEFGPRTSIEGYRLARPIIGEASIYHNQPAGSNFGDSFTGGRAHLDKQAASGFLSGMMGTSVYGTDGESRWSIELYLEDFIRGGSIELFYRDGGSTTTPMEPDLLWVGVTSLAATNLDVKFSDDYNTIYLSEKLGTITGNYELTGVLRRDDPVKKTFKKDQAKEEYSTELRSLLLDVTDAGSIKAGPDTDFILSAEDEAFLLEQHRGVLRQAISKLPPGYTFKVATPQAILGVRGTVFSTSVRDGIETIVVHEGSVEVQDRASAKVLILNENQMLILDGQGFPDEVMTAPEGLAMWWEQDYSWSPMREDPFAKLFRTVITVLAVLAGIILLIIGLIIFFVVRRKRKRTLQK